MNPRGTAPGSRPAGPPRRSAPWAAGVRASLVSLTLSLLVPLAAALVVALGHPRPLAARLALVLASWCVPSLLVAYLFLPGFDLPWRVVRRAPRGGDRRGVALTFDDGPHPDTTPALLDALARAGVRATFFVVGEHVRRWPDLVRRIVAEGHGVGNHTQRHRLLTFRTRAEVAREIAECQEALAELGIRPALFRPPHGFKPVGLHRVLAWHGLRLAAWQGTVRDTDAPSVAAIVARALGAARPGRILLLHDTPTTRGQTAAALADLVAGLRGRGLDIIPL